VLRLSGILFSVVYLKDSVILENDVWGAIRNKAEEQIHVNITYISFGGVYS
jgi:hypothetical protein